MSESRVRRALNGDTSLLVMRAFRLDDIEIVPRSKGGDGRTVTAYAAVFNRPTEIVDMDGHYNEQIAPAAFNKSLADRSRKIGVFYNHGKTLHGTPSERASVPLGSPVEPPRPDGNGLITVSRYNRTALADDVLEAIKNGDITGQSFTGVFLHSDPDNGPYYGRNGQLETVTRKEIALIEYGPTPIPAYQDAEIVGVRNRELLMGEGHRAGVAGPQPYEREPGENVQCPACERFNMPDAVYCDQCGFELPDSAFPDGQQPYTRDSGENVQCPNCLRFNDEDAIYCDQCGQALPASAYTESVLSGQAQTGSSSGRQLDPVTVLADHFGWTPDQVAELGEQERSLLLDSIDAAHGGPHERADVDNSTWDGDAAMAACTTASDYRSVCAGEKTIGDPSERQHWALPHHARPGAAPNANGVSAAIGRLPQTQDLKNKQAAEAHLQAHKKSIGSGSDSSGSNSSGSSGRSGAATSGGSDDSKSGQRTGEPPAAAGQAEPPAKHSASGDGTGRTQDMTDRQMTVDERAARQDDVRARLREIDQQYSGAALPDEARSEWTALQEELVEHREAIKDAKQRAAYLAQVLDQNPDAAVAGTDQGSGYDDAQAQNRSANGGGQLPTGRQPAPAGRGGFGGALLGNGRRPHNIYDVAGIRNDVRSLDDLPQAYRDRAMWSLEEATFPGDRSRSREDIQSGITRLLEYRDDRNGTLARHMLLTGSPQYRQAFAKLLGHLHTGALDGAEQRALAMGTPAAWEPGSYPVPYQLDPTVTLTSNGAINPLRTISRVEQIVGKEWLGVTSPGITVTRGNEADEANDAAPNLTQPGVAPERVQAFVPFSVEVEQDWNGLMAEIAMMLADAKDIEEAESFITGNGTAPQPGGIVGTLAETQWVTTAAAGGFTVPDDLDTVEDAMAPRFRPQASWIAAKSTFGAIRKAAVAAGDQFDVWARLGSGTPPELIGYPAYEASAMSTDMTTTPGTVPYLVLGDFKQFIIVDRIGMSIELVPHVFGTARNMPTGQRGIFALWRNNSAILAQNAFRALLSK